MARYVLSDLYMPIRIDRKVECASMLNAASLVLHFTICPGHGLIGGARDQQASGVGSAQT